MSDETRVEWGVRVETGYVYVFPHEGDADYFAANTKTFKDSAVKVSRTSVTTFTEWEVAAAAVVEGRTGGHNGQDR